MRPPLSSNAVQCDSLSARLIFLQSVNSASPPSSFMLLACQKLEAAMKFRTTSPAFVAAAVFFAAMYAVSAAQAFTIENQGGASGGQGFLDLDKPAAPPDRLAPASRFGNENGQTTITDGNTT